MNAKEIPGQSDLADLHLLGEIDRNPGISQREMSRKLGLSLGMVNLLVRRMAKKAWIKIRSIPGRRLLYALTPRGLAEKIRKARDFLRLSFRYYSDLKRSVAEGIRETGRPRPRIAAYRAGELARIVAEATEEAGGRFAGTFEAADELPAVDAVVVMDRPAKAERDAWQRKGIRLIDLS